MVDLLDLSNVRIYQSIRCRLGLGPSLVRQRLLGRDVTVFYGTIGARPDYDYGWAYALIRESSSLFDLGCNVGLDSLVACLDDPDRRVLAADASPKTLAAAEENLRRNGFHGRVRLVCGFISDVEDQDVDFWSVGTGAAGSGFASHAHSARKRNSSFKVRTRTIDSLAAEAGFDPDLVKLDVEGAEVAALRGAVEMTRRSRPRYLVEMHTLAEKPMQVAGDEVIAWSRALGYKAYFLPEHRHVTDSEPFAHRGRCHLLLLPEEQPYPELLRGIPEGESMDAVRERCTGD